jgi:hypothetical protein
MVYLAFMSVSTPAVSKMRSFYLSSAARNLISETRKKKQKTNKSALIQTVLQKYAAFLAVHTVQTV